MSIKFAKRLNEYEQAYQNSSIEYKDTSGSWQTDAQPRLRSISSALQTRGYISREQLRKIGKWKSPRIDRHLKKNTATEVEVETAAAFSASSSEQAAETLIELNGVGVPVASSILTMYDPTEYAVIDYRVLRALPVIDPQLADPRTYRDYRDFLEHFRSYGDRPDTYQFYMDRVDQIAADEGLTPREVDMALWAYDKNA